MRVRYEPAFLDAVLSVLIQDREASGDLHFTREYHALAGAAYRLAPAAREEAFRQIHERLFQRWNLSATFWAILRDFPDLRSRIETLWVAHAPTPRDEGADVQAAGGTAAILRLLPRRFLDPERLQRLLRHELTHLADLLDPAFAYEHTDRVAGTMPTEDALVRERYRLLWDITIDSRLLCTGRATVASREERRTEFEAQYPGVPAPLLKKSFGRLWEGPRPSHPALLEMAIDPGRALFELQGATLRSLPGSRCPLCHFPSWSLRQGPEEVPGPFAALIQRDFPGWQPELGACERCMEGYATLQGVA